MRRLVVLAALALAACSTTGLTPHLSERAQIAAAKAETTVDLGVGLADRAYLAARSHLSASQRAEVKSYLVTLHALLRGARAAETIGDEAGLADKIKAIAALRTEVLKITGPAPAQ